MTVETPETVLALLGEDTTLRVYQYLHALTGQVFYAVFPHGQYDDMAWAPQVADPVLLYDAGQLTAAGRFWMKGQGTLRLAPEAAQKPPTTRWSS
jgi:hypothetical protein